MKSFLVCIILIILSRTVFAATFLLETKGDTSEVNRLYHQADALVIENPESCIKIGQKALLLAQKINYLKGVANAYLVIGAGNIYLGEKQTPLNHRGAVESLIKALKIYQQINDLEGQGSVYHDLGNVYFYDSDYENSIHQFQKAIAIFRRTGSKKKLLGSYSGLAIDYSFLGKYAQAQNFYHLVVANFKSLGDDDRLIINQLGMGVCYLNSKNYDSAKYVLSDVQKNAKKQSQNTIEYYAEFNLAKIHITQNQLSEANTAVQRGLNLTIKMKDKNYESGFYKLSFLIEFAGKQYKKASTNLYKAYQADSIQMEKYQADEINFIQEQDKTRTKESENALLLEKNKFEQVKFWALLLLAAFLLITTVLIIYILRLRSSTLELELLKSQINPHFLFNALNSISALVSIEPEKSRRAILLLSDLLGFTLNYSKEREIELSQELAETKKYLELEKLRFGEKLQLEYEIDEQAGNLRIPPALILTLAENAIKHGRPNANGQIFISIAIAQKKNTIAIIVKNSGAINRDKGKNNGLGLQMVRKRLVALYGKKSKFNFDDENGLVVVIIEIPIK